MPDTSQPAFAARDPLVALALLSRLPAPLDHAAGWARAAASCWAFPLVGAALGGLVWAAMATAAWAGLSAPLAALLGVGAHLALTGALHEDGLADCADGFFGGATRARRLEIMKDSRLGTYGVAALVLALLARWLLYQALLAAPLALIAAGALSRAGFGAAMRWIAPARPEGLAGGAGRPPSASALAGLALGALGAAALGWDAPWAMLAAALAGGAALALAWRKIGGQTGDALGAMQVAAELTALAALGG